MGSYRDALMENLMAAITNDEAKEASTSEDDQRDMRAEAARQRALMEGQ